MSLTLVLPPAPPAPAGTDYPWAQCDPARTQLTGQGSAPAALLPGRGEVVVIVPASALSWQRVVLPPGSLGGGRLRSVLAGLLEERLLDEPEQLHFALEPGARTGQPVWVAVCQRAWLQGVVQTLEGAGRRPARLLPEFSPRPDEAPPALYAIGAAGTSAPTESESGRLVLCDAQGVLTLPLTAEGVALAGPLPEDATLSAEPAVAELAEALLGRPLGRNVALAPAARRWLDALDTPWDLAQFDFASTGRARLGKKLAGWGHALWRAPRWRAARWGAGLLVAAQLIGVNAWAWKERNALQAKRAAVGQVLTSTFPAVRLVVDAPLQMQREVAALQQATGGVTAADLEPMLAALAASLPPGRVPAAIDYSGAQLRLRGLELTPAELDALAADMAPRGYLARGEGDVLLVQAEVGQ